jgi:hypothetical protein
MSFGGSAPKPDPLLQQQEQAAKQDKINTIQDQVAALTDNLVRIYGAKVALGGSGPTVPTGGTATTGKGPFSFSFLNRAPGGSNPIPLIGNFGSK